MIPSLRTAAGVAVLSIAVLGACSDGATGPTEPDVSSITVNAANTWTYIALGETATPVSVTDPTTSSAWDIAFYGTAVMVNGGAAGPGGLAAFCVCQNAAATNAQVQAYTAANQLNAFEAVGATAIPASDSAWKVDALAPAISGWYRYDLTTHTISAAPERSFYIRTAGGTAYAKLHVTAITGATRTTPGRVTIEYAMQPSAGAPMGPARQATIDVPATGRVSFDLETGTVTEAGWDIAFEGFAIRVNGGVSGSGAAGAVAVTDPFESITDASDAPASVYRADAFGGAFDSHRWYRYNLTGTDHQVWPTFDVYLVRKGSDVYKLQLTNYYSAAGESRHVTVRYAKVSP